jgi:phage baseplate assembly protein W
MPDIDTPQFDLPFRFEAKDDGTVQAAVVEQDSTQDVLNCVEAVLRTPLGYREELPDFGVEDPTFRQMPVDPSRIAQAIERWEPRANITVDSYPDSLDEALAHVRVQVESAA